jgi:hypothetical protein
MTETRTAHKTSATSKAAPPTSAARKPGRTAKPVVASAAQSRTVPAPTDAAAKPKHKLVRDSFTIPKAEYAVLENLKERAANLKRPTKKSELLRAGVAILHAMTDKAFLSALSGVASLKTGRPKGSGASAEKPTSPAA